MDRTAIRYHSVFDDRANTACICEVGEGAVIGGLVEIALPSTGANAERNSERARGRGCNWQGYFGQPPNEERARRRESGELSGLRAPLPPALRPLSFLRIYPLVKSYLYYLQKG